MTTNPTHPCPPIDSTTVPWTEWTEGTRFGERYRHLSRAALGDNYRIGVAIEELQPGRRSTPAHFHLFEEEHVYLLEGHLTAQIGGEHFGMNPGDYVCFPAGHAAGHCLVNDSDATCRYVIIGENNPNEVAVYTDSNKVLVRGLGRRALLDLAARRDYWHGEDTGAPFVLQDPIHEPLLPTAAKPFPPVSTSDAEVEESDDGPHFGGSTRSLSWACVGENHHVGVRIESPAPGKRLAPRHYHLFEEEHALVLEGELTLLLGDETFTLKPGDYACFPAGLPVPHAFRNDTDQPCHYLMIGERLPHDVCVYPDSNKVHVAALGRGKSVLDLSAVRGYWDGE